MFAVSQGTAVPMDLRRAAVVLGAGGERAIPWEVGVLAGLTAGGVDLLRVRRIMGTSAGALVASRVALGIDPRADAARVASRDRPARVPQAVRSAAPRAVEQVLRLRARDDASDERDQVRRIGRWARSSFIVDQQAHLARTAERLPSGGWPKNLFLCALDCESGERLRLSPRRGASVVHGVAAARAIPGLIEPVTVSRSRLMDAAVISGTNADLLLADGIDLALVISPVPHAPRSALEVAFHAALAQEERALGAAGIPVVVIRPAARERPLLGEDLFAVADAPGSLAAGRRAGIAASAELQQISAVA